MTEQTQTQPQYRWPDLSPVIRQYIVVDDQGRFGIAYADPVHHPDALFAHPVGVPATVVDVDGRTWMTNTVWTLKPDGAYTGIWCDYSGPTAPSTVPPELLRRIVIMDDLGYLLPDRWAEQGLAGSDQGGYWDYGATLGRVGGEPPVKGQTGDEMTVAQAFGYAREVGEVASVRGIRWAASRGHIPGARKSGRDWLIPYEGFNHYLDHRPRPGRK